MPSANTFDVPPIRDFVRRYLPVSSCAVSIDPFARNKGWATYTNDLNPNTAAEYHMDVLEFLGEMVRFGVRADVAIFDPPYSPRQIKECYDSIGLKMKAQDAMRTNWQAERNLIDKILKPNGYCLSFGWNTNGMGRKRHYEIVEILIVAHGMGHNDTLCTAEQKPPYEQISL